MATDTAPVQAPTEDEILADMEREIEEAVIRARVRLRGLERRQDA